MRRKLIASATPPLNKKEKIEKMRINKKIYTTSIITILTISMVLTVLPTAVFAVLAVNPAVPATGAPGTQVTVTGTSSTTGGEVVLYWDQIHSWDGTSGELARTYAVGTDYTLTAVIPAATAGVHFLTADDLSSDEVPVTTTFTIIGGISINPKVGLAGDVITVTGTGYNPTESITMTYWDGAAMVPLTTTPIIPQTSALGAFTCTFVVPTDAANQADNIAAEDVTGETGTATLAVGPYIVLTPTKGLKSSSVQVAGRGFTPSKVVDIRWYLNLIDYVTVLDDSPIGGTGGFTVTISVPLLPDAVAPGSSYTITAIDNNTPTPIQASALFTLIQNADITLAPTSGKVSTTVAVAGTWFSASKSLTVRFDATQVAVLTTLADGSFSTTFTVPADATLAAHTVNATDSMGVSVTKTYTVVVDTFNVETRATEYVRMDYISIRSSATIVTDVILRITDPTGLIFYQEAVVVADWDPILGGLNQIPYNELAISSMPIPSDAPLGGWNFTCWNAGGTAILDTNLFAVAAKATQQDVLDALEDMEGTIQGIVTTSEGRIIAAVNTKTGTIMTDLSALDPKLQGIEDTVVIIATMLGEVQVDISALNFGTMGVDITAIKGDVATIKTNIGTVDTKVSNLDPVIGAIAGQNAEVQTKLGTLEGKITSIEGNTATIETSVGTLQADITDVKAEIGVDMTPVWIAVVLSLVAAIAAIFAVITIRQKIAG